uniref:Putative secreted protein n=1 Tax=Anopheles darlingi TaxID=43151 RepID=A0A2M4D8J4_ANODA
MSSSCLRRAGCCAMACWGLSLSRPTVSSRVGFGVQLMPEWKARYKVSSSAFARCSKKRGEGLISVAVKCWPTHSVGKPKATVSGCASNSRCHAFQWTSITICQRVF